MFFSSSARASLLMPRSILFRLLFQEHSQYFRYVQFNFQMFVLGNNLATNHEIASLIPGISNLKILQNGLVFKWGQFSLVMIIAQLLDGKVADLIKKVDINRLDRA